MARRRAAALVRICSDWLGGGSDRPAKPLLTVHVNLADATAPAAGMVELGRFTSGVGDA